jgi:hypothetical protein
VPALARTEEEEPARRLLVGSSRVQRLGRLFALGKTLERHSSTAECGVQMEKRPTVTVAYIALGISPALDG